MRIDVGAVLAGAVLGAMVGFVLTSAPRCVVIDGPR